MPAIIELAKLMWHFTKQADDARVRKLTLPEGVNEDCNHAYIDDGDAMHLLDVYSPAGCAGPLPVIIDVHGGGWMYGDKELNKPYCLFLASRGYLVFNISYRLVPNVTTDDQVRDVMAALQWIADHLSAYPAKTDEIYLTGDSAGGMLASFAAALLGSEKLRSVFGTMSPDLHLTALALTAPVAYMDEDGFVGVYTRAMWGKDYREKPTAPYMNLDALLKETTLPPTFLVTSSGDIMALKQTRRAARDIAKAGIESELADFPKFEGQDLPHVFSVLYPDNKAGKLAIDRMLAFFKRAKEQEAAQ